MKILFLQCYCARKKKEENDNAPILLNNSRLQREGKTMGSLVSQFTLVPEHFIGALLRMIFHNPLKSMLNDTIDGDPIIVV